MYNNGGSEQRAMFQTVVFRVCFYVSFISLKRLINQDRVKADRNRKYAYNKDKER